MITLRATNLITAATSIYCTSGTRLRSNLVEFPRTPYFFFFFFSASLARLASPAAEMVFMSHTMADLMAHSKTYLSLYTRGTLFLDEGHTVHIRHHRDGKPRISDNSDPRRAVQSSRWWPRSGDLALALKKSVSRRESSRSSVVGLAKFRDFVSG